MQPVERNVGDLPLEPGEQLLLGVVGLQGVVVGTGQFAEKFLVLIGVGGEGATAKPHRAKKKRSSTEITMQT